MTGENCPRWCSGGDYEEAVKAVTSAYIDGVGAGLDPSNPKHVLDSVLYMAGVVAGINAQYPDLESMVEAGQDGKQIMVRKKGNQDFTEHYKMWTGGGSSTYTRQIDALYAATCFPSRWNG